MDFVVLYFRSKDKDFYFLPLDKHGCDSEWVGRGDWKFNRTEKCYEITKSNVGYLFPKTLLWDDYSFEFDFKIVSGFCAWIVRAQNLSNYVMFQCGTEGINPHIRLDGQWVVYKHKDANVKLSFESDKKLSFDKWYKAKLICDKRCIKIKILLDGKTVFDRQWEIPNQLTLEFQQEEQTKEKIKVVREIDFDFGAIGFRDYGSEKAFIKNVYLNKL